MYALSAQEARAVRLFGVSPKEGGAVGGVRRNSGFGSRREARTGESEGHTGTRGPQGDLGAERRQKTARGLTATAQGYAKDCAQVRGGLAEARGIRPTLSSEILRGWISLLVSALGLLYTT